MGVDARAMALNAAPDGGQLGRAVLTGLVGAGIAKSRTPLMHEREGARLGLRYIYHRFDTATPDLAGADIGAILQAARLCGFAGLNVTYPFKQAIIPHLDGLSDNARRLGAVNTVVLDQGRAFGHNTDLWGFAEGFRREMDGVERKTVIQFGAGGAGTAVARALLQLGAERLFLIDIDHDRAAALSASLNSDFGPGRAQAQTITSISPEYVDGVVNATPMGMASQPGTPVPQGFLRPGMWVADIVYFPLETALLAEARATGCRVLTGEPMAVFQAVRAFELFTGLRPDSAAMKATFDAFD